MFGIKKKVKKPLFLWMVTDHRGYRAIEAGYWETREQARKAAHRLAVKKNLPYELRPSVTKKVVYQAV